MPGLHVGGEDGGVVWLNAIVSALIVNQVGMGQSQIENAVVSTFFITEFTIQK